MNDTPLIVKKVRTAMLKAMRSKANYGYLGRGGSGADWGPEAEITNWEDILDAGIAAIYAEGAKVLFREPTEAMNSAGYREWNRLRAGDTHLIYRAMWDAAPALPQTQRVRRL